VPDIAELRARLARSRNGLHLGARRAAERHAQRLAAMHERLRRAPLLALERRRARLDTVHARLGALSPIATLERGYAIVRRARDGRILRDPAEAPSGEGLAIRLARGEVAATVDGTGDRS
jgi:exodeoxyribonuclease VII large subunit